MGQIIFFDSARKGGTGKTKSAMNTAVTMAKYHGRTLLIEADYTNPNYASTYKQFIEMDDKKNSYEWFNDKIERRVKRINESSTYLAELKAKNDQIERLKQGIERENPGLNGQEVKEKMDECLEEMVNKHLLTVSGPEPKLKEYLQKSKLENLDILIGKKNQNDLLGKIVDENKKTFGIHAMFVENKLKDSFVHDVQKLSKEYEHIIIDGYAGYDLLTRKLFESADKHVIIAENNEASVESVYNNMYDTINRIFSSMVSQSIGALELSLHYDIGTSNKTGTRVYNEIIEKAYEARKDLNECILKKARGEELDSDEKEIFRRFEGCKDEIDALINESEYKKDKLTTLCIVMNKVNADILGKQRGLAIKNYNSLKKGLAEYGINAITPGFNSNADSGVIYYYKDFYREDVDGLPLVYLDPKHDFSNQIKHLASFINSDESWRKTK